MQFSGGSLCVWQLLTESDSSGSWLKAIKMFVCLK